jgi:PhoPQ-activated pathogenicity-related protein
MMILSLTAFCWFCDSSGAAEPPLEGPTGLDRYVAQPDPSYRWTVQNRFERDGLTTYVVDLKSQTWRSEDEVDRTLWQHWLIVAKPPKVTTDTAFLFITGGRNGSDPPTRTPGEIRQIALATGSVVAQISMVPNQPLVFHDDGQERYEDDLIGYSVNQYLQSRDETWPALLPMVKSAVRAMDTVQALMASQEGGEIEINHFVVAGGSKRGWTTWLTSAVDDRVIACVPIVIDMLNTIESMRHHYAAYGFYAPAVGDYEQHEVLQRMNSPEYAKLSRWIDPFGYRERLTMPKFLVNSTGDQFFVPDSSQFYFDELKGEKHLRYVANSDHGLDGSDALVSIIAFYQQILRGEPRPEFTWSFPDANTIQVRTQDEPKQVVLWHANNPQARDFRKDIIGPAYQSTPLTEQGDGRYVARVDTPPEGWTAFLVELTFETDSGVPLKLTTPVRVVPDVLPFGDKTLPTVEQTEPAGG